MSQSRYITDLSRLVVEKVGGLEAISEHVAEGYESARNNTESNPATRLRYEKLLMDLMLAGDQVSQTDELLDLNNAQVRGTIMQLAVELINLDPDFRRMAIGAITRADPQLMMDYLEQVPNVIEHQP